MRLPTPLVAIALALVLCADAATLLLHDTATPYTPEQALADFRAQGTPSPAGSAAASVALPSPTPGPTAARVAPGGSPSPAARSAASVAPAPVARSDEANPEGVYAYATSGGEDVDLLGGSRHDYPAETTVSYRRTACGVQTHWQPLEERYSTDDLCRTSAGGELRRAFERHTFFGQSEDEDLACGKGLVLLPANPRPGQVSTGTCRSDDTSVALRIEVHELTRMTVDDRSVEVVHLLVHGQLTGSARGVTKREEWITRSGLLVRVVAVVNSDRDTPAGTAHYVEQYELKLRSLDPQS